MRCADGWLWIYGTLVFARLHATPRLGLYGVKDNLVMIQAGDMIDNSIGVTFGRLQP